MGINFIIYYFNIMIFVEISSVRNQVIGSVKTELDVY